MNELGQGPVVGLVRLCLLNTSECYSHSQPQPPSIFTTVFPSMDDPIEPTTILQHWYCSHFTDVETDLGQLNHLSKTTADTWRAWSCRNPTPNPHNSLQEMQTSLSELSLDLHPTAGSPNCASGGFSIEK